MTGKQRLTGVTQRDPGPRELRRTIHSTLGAGLAESQRSSSPLITHSLWIITTLTVIGVLACDDASLSSEVSTRDIGLRLDDHGVTGGVTGGATGGVSDHAGASMGGAIGGVVGERAGDDAGVTGGELGGDPTSPLPSNRAPLSGPALEGAMLLDDTPPERLRVGWVDQDEEVLAGPDLSCRLGSVRLENAEIRVCIQGMSSLTQFKRRGGNLVDVLRWDAPLTDGISEIIVTPGFGEVDPEAIEILSEGQGEYPAVVQVRGVARGSRILTSYIPSYVPRPTPVINEYHLYPDREELEIHTWIEVGDQPISLRVSDLIIWADPAVLYYPLKSGDRLPVTPAYLGAHLPNISYLWKIDGRDELSLLQLPDIPVFPVGVGQVQAPGNVTLYVKRDLYVGQGGVSPLAEAYVSMPPEPCKVDVQITARGPDQRPLSADMYDDPDTLLYPPHLLDQVSFEIYTRRDDGGLGVLIAHNRAQVMDLDTEEDVASHHHASASVHLSPGAYWIRVPQWSGGAVQRAFDVVSTSQSTDVLNVDLGLPAPGRLTLREQLLSIEGMMLSELRGSKWTFTPEGESITERERVTHFVLGEGSLLLPPGSWRVQVSRGWHFSAQEIMIDVERGSSQTIEATLIEELPLPGWSSGEFHQHSSPSVDSEVSLETRVLSNIAEGVGFMVPSDHDVIVDYPRIVNALGYARDIGAPITGLEISPRSGHLGAYGIAYQEDAPEGAGGAPPLSRKIAEGDEGRPATWALFTIPELIVEARQRGADIIQLNHPRDSTGYFDTVRFNPESGDLPQEHEHWTSDFDTLEVFNGAGDFCAVMRDWQALLLQGEHIVGVGNSDSHDVGKPVGYPRNYIPTSADTPQEISRVDIVDALRRGRVSIGGGAIIELTDDMMWGDTLTGPRVNIALRLRTPSFTRLSRVVALLNGHEVWSRELESPLESLVDFDELVTLDLTEDGPLIFFAEGPRLSVVHPGQPTFALANPVWIDADGDGQVTLPRDYRAPDRFETSFCR